MIVKCTVVCQYSWDVIRSLLMPFYPSPLSCTIRFIINKIAFAIKKRKKECINLKHSMHVVRAEINSWIDNFAPAR